MAMLLRVKDWDANFENNRTRNLKKLDWVPLPNTHDGDGYTELLDHQDGPLHYAAWVVIVQVASRCQMRGTLMRDGDRPYDSASLARRTRMPVEIFDSAIPRLIEIGWLEAEQLQVDGDIAVTEIPHSGAGIQHPDATIRHPPVTEGKGREWNEGKGKCCGETQQGASSPPPPDEAPALLTFPCDGKPQQWHLRQSYADELQELYPKLDVEAECRKALAWVKASSSRQKTANGMKRFLVGWLNTETNRTNTPRAGPVAATTTRRLSEDELRAKVGRSE